MRLTLFAAALASLACLTPTAGAARPGTARAGPYRLEVVDEAGRPLPTFTHGARTYVLGTLGERYLLRVRNDGARRVEAVVSVDGRDVLDGLPAATGKHGYLVDPGGEVTIDGFRVSREAVAAFRFGSVPRSYAALRGDARDVGVIGVALFVERERPRPATSAIPWREGAPGASGPRLDAKEQAPAAAPVAPDGIASRQRAERQGLGTEFAEEHESHVRLVQFERASSRPDAVLTVRYDDRDGLLAAGVDVDGSWWARRDEAARRDRAQPFRRDGFAEPPPGWRPER